MTTPETAVGVGAQERAMLSLLESWREELMEFVSAAVRVPSVTGTEGDFGSLVAGWLHDQGFECERRTISADLVDRLDGFEAEGNLDARPNVFGWLRASGGGGAPLVLSTHQDVVSPGDLGAWDRDPWGGERSGGRILGRGSADMKGSIGAALFALRALRETGHAPAADVELQCVIAEESGGLGTLSALETETRPAAAIVLEPSELVVRSACSGCVHFTVSVEGRSAHGATPWMGVSAIEKLISVHDALRELGEARRLEQDHPLFADLPDGAPLSIGIARAGEWRSSVADRGALSGRLGVMPGETLAHGRKQIVETIRRAAADDEWLREHPPAVSWDSAGFPAWDTDPQERIIEVLAGAVQTVSGTTKLGAVTFGSDAGHFANAGVPVVIFGPGRITDAHAPNESVSEDEVLAAAKVLALTVARFSPAGLQPR